MSNGKPSIDTNLTQWDWHRKSQEMFFYIFVRHIIILFIRERKKMKLDFFIV